MEVVTTKNNKINPTIDIGWRIYRQEGNRYEYVTLEIDR